jgi:hypothetical protein
MRDQEDFDEVDNYPTKKPTRDRKSKNQKMREIIDPVDEEDSAPQIKVNGQNPATAAGDGGHPRKQQLQSKTVDIRRQ